MPEKRTSKDRKKHLYLVFDDWDSGYSIRKVSLSRRSRKRSKQPSSSDPGEQHSEQPSSSGSGSGNGGAKPLPLPVFMRLPAQRGFPYFFTSAFGTKIMLMLRGSSDNDDDVVPTIDVRDHTITFEPEAPLAGSPICFPGSDDTLFALDMGTFEVLWKPEQRGGRGSWAWQPLACPPFVARVDTSSYGVQPDGCILVSTKKDGGTTFIFDTKENVWKLYGDWMFPFTGHGYYDHSLGGFVGLSKHPETFGRLFCCSMASTVTGRGGLHPSPDFKCTKEAVYSKHPAEQHVSATLVHMSQGRFCLVECVSIDNGKTIREPPPVADPRNFWVPPVSAPGPVSDPGNFIVPPVSDPGNFIVPPVSDPEDFMLPPVSDPEDFMLPPVSDPEDLVLPPWFVPPPAFDMGKLLSDPKNFVLPPVVDPWDFVGGGPQSGRYMYRVKTFSLGCDMKGDLKLKHTKEHCYRLPHEARIGSVCLDPVAFWL